MSEPLEVTVDEVARGALKLKQPRRGYRFNIDALILAEFVASSVDQPPELVIDLGCGCGVVGLLLARRWPSCRAVLVEIQPELAQLARSNARDNGLEDRVQVVCADLVEISRWAPREGTRTLALSNPPYYPLRKGRVSADPMVAAAKHELSCTLAQLLSAAERALPPGQSLLLIHDARRRAELMEELELRHFSWRRERFVLPLPMRPAKRLMWQLVRRTSGADRVAWQLPPSEPPLVIHQQPGVYSGELRRILGDPTPAVR
jgi:tRNA1Val (adenine37-N6)-methyltransferase